MCTATLTIGMALKQQTFTIVRAARPNGYVKIVEFFVIKITKSLYSLKSINLTGPAAIALQSVTAKRLINRQK